MAELSKGSAVFPGGGHWQGIQIGHHDELKQQLCFLSRDSHTQAYFATAVLDRASAQAGTIRHVQFLPSDGLQPPLRHAGGMQRMGDYLVIGVEDNQDKLRSEIQFWDISVPFAPRLRTPLTIKRQSDIPKAKTAGAVGIVKQRHCHVLVVANWDARDLDIYQSNGRPLADDACRFSLIRRWSHALAHRQAWQPDQAWESYQAINLVSDLAANVYLLGFTTDRVGKDIIDLFSIDLTRDSADIVHKLNRKRPVLKGKANFRAAGGLFVKSATALGILAAESRGQESVVINVSPTVWARDRQQK